MAPQPRLYISEDNSKRIYQKKGISHDESTKQPFICPITGNTYNTRKQFWYDYVIPEGLDIDNLDYKRKVSDDVESLSKLIDKSQWSWIWNVYFDKNITSIVKGDKPPKGKKDDKEKVHRLLGLIDFETYVTLVRIYKGEIDIQDVLSSDDVTVDDGFSDISINLTNKLSSEYKKERGIFFTPPTIVNRTIEELIKYDLDISNILEPSCGSCEFVCRIMSKYPNASIDCVEYDKTIFDQISELTNDKISIVNKNFIDYKITKKYDLVIGNPPYFVMKKKECPSKYSEYLEGRPNIYLLFILKCLDLLNHNGVLAFILPNNFLNCSYYNKVRSHINKKYSILNIIDCDDGFIDTKQATHILIIQNKKPTDNSKYTLSIHDYVLFNTNYNVKRINNLYEGSTSLNKLGFNVSVGKVVWNQVKDKLTDDDSKTLLIYSGDIKNNLLEIRKYSNHQKKNYIDCEGYNNPLLLVNRGYGKGKYTFNYCLIDIDKPFQVENHLICISPRIDTDKGELVDKYKKIIQSFDDSRTSEFVNLYCTNDAMNTFELQYNLPIYN